MKMDVPENIKKEVADCPNDFSCITTGRCGGNEPCEVEDIDGKNMVFLKGKGRTSCPYNISLYGDHVCRCPVNYYIQRNKKLL